MRVAERAGIAEHVRPHDLRHAYAEHIARTADTKGRAVSAWARNPRYDRKALTARKATTGIEPV